MSLYLSREGYFAGVGVINNAVGTLNGTTNVTVVGAPGLGNIRQVIAVTMPNSTGGALIANLYLNDNAAAPTVTLIDHVGAVAAATTYTSADRLPVILLKDNESLEMDTTAAATPTFYAVWAEISGLLQGGLQ